MQTELDSFLIEISALILAFKDEDGQPLVNKILDKTGMKGTGVSTVPTSVTSSRIKAPASLLSTCTQSQWQSFMHCQHHKTLASTQQCHVLTIPDMSCHSSQFKMWPCCMLCRGLPTNSHCSVLAR